MSGEEQCKTCRWFVRDSSFAIDWPVKFTPEEEDAMNFLGHCKKRAPVALQNQPCAFALVTTSSSCGDWEEKK